MAVDPDHGESSSPRNRPPVVFAIVVGCNSRRWLETCFSSLLLSDYPALQLIYVDNDSRDGSLELVRQAYPTVKTLASKVNLGFAGGNNLGLRLAVEEQADYIFLVNPDTRTPSNLISGLVDFMGRHTGYGIVGPMQSVYGETDDMSSLNEWSRTALENGERHAFYHWEPWRRSDAGDMQGRADRTLEHAYVQGAALFLRRDVLDAIGLFDENYHSYFEEVDLCRRTRMSGYRVALLLDLYIQHKGGGHGEERTSGYRSYHYTRNKYYYLFTDPGYKLWESLRLARRFLSHDMRHALIGRTRNRRDCRQLLAIVWWLLRHSLIMYRERGKRSELLKQRTNQRVCGPPEFVQRSNNQAVKG